MSKVQCQKSIFVGLFFALCSLLFAASASAAPVQEVTAQAGNGLSFSATIATPQTGDSLIAVIGFASPYGATVDSVDGGGVTWAKAPASTFFSPLDLEVWYGHGSDGSSSTVTINATAILRGRGGVNITEWVGLAQQAPEDGNSNTGETVSGDPPVTTGSVNTSGGALVIAATALRGDAYQAGPGFAFTRLSPVNGLNGANPYLETAFREPDFAGTFSTAWDLTDVTPWQWNSVIVVFGE